MSKATCTKCGFEALLTDKSPEGTAFWSIKEAVGNLVDQIKNHDCYSFHGGTQ